MRLDVGTAVEVGVRITVAVGGEIFVKAGIGVLVGVGDATDMTVGVGVGGFPVNRFQKAFQVCLN
jgi:hypothetical protein